MTKVVKKQKCVFDTCTTICTEDDHCFGCNKYICEKHSTNFELPMGGHSPEQHWEEEEWDDDDVV